MAVGVAGILTWSGSDPGLGMGVMSASPSGMHMPSIFFSFHILDQNAIKKIGKQTAVRVPAMDPQHWGVLPPAPLHFRGFGCVCGSLELGQLWGCRGPDS